MNLIDDTSTTQPTQHPTPGSLNFVPTDPEVPVENIASVAEVAPAVEKGAETKQENEPLYETSSQKTGQQKSAPITQSPPASTTPQATPKIIDKSNEITHTHHLTHTQDKLTELADTDEEKFIEEVEAAHGHK